MKFGFGSASRFLRNVVFAVFCVTAAAFSAVAGAQSYIYDNRTVDYVGVVSWLTYGAFVAFVEGLPSGGAGQVPAPCLNGVATFDPTQIYSKYWYMTFLTAKASGLHVQVDISQDGYNNCFIASARIKN